ncbi:MAG: aldehyde ferredoxin oxidoreductase family protein [Chloroflexi bacterium]|nr:aldehyde ferredoxin oxidoreductase family protein [Chloroflexota bacterium]
MHGWAGQRLRVYLTEGKIVKEAVSEELGLRYLGGRGLNSRVLLEEMPPHANPLGPDSVLAVATGTLSGTFAPASARWTVSAKSPITMGFGDGNGGGDFAAGLKFAGYDQVIFYGQSPKPVYLLIDGDHVALKDATHLWGKTLSETRDLLVKDLGGQEISYLAIGPAGENLSLVTKVFCNTRAGGKGGMGAVAGAKKLKAIVVCGTTRPVKVARPADFYNAVKRAHRKVSASPFFKMMREGGSLNWMRISANNGCMPARNMQAGYFEGWQKLTAEVYEKHYAVKPLTCFACPIRCSSYFRVKEGSYATFGSNQQYGTIYPFTVRLGIDNMEFALKATTVCDELGLDTHLCGAVISFAMEAWQRGLLSLEDTDGLDLSWGNIEAVMKLLPKVAYREGFGAVLADGSKKASEQIPGSEVCLVQVKGMDVSHMYPGPGEGRDWQLAYSTATRGPDHLRGSGGYGKDNPRLVKILGEAGAKALLDPQNYKGQGVNIALSNYFAGIVHSLGLCTRVTGVYGAKNNLLDEYDLAELFSTATGIDASGDDLMKAGERICNVERLFNVREGFGRKDDMPPERFFVEGISPGRAVPGPTGINRARYEEMLDEYYAFNGWDSDGVPTKKKLAELGLDCFDWQAGPASRATDYTKQS